MSLSESEIDAILAEKVRDQKRRWYLANRETVMARSRARYAANRDAICAQWRERYRNDPAFRAKELAKARRAHHAR